MSLTTNKVDRNEENFLKPDIFTSSKFSNDEYKMKKLLRVRQNSVTGIKIKRSLVGGVNNFDF